MNWLDIILIIGLALSVILGIRAGLIKVAFMLVGGIIGVVLAGRYSDGLADKLSFIPDYGTAGIIAFVLIVVLTIVVAMIIGTIVKKVVHILPLVGWADKLGGGIIGLLSGAIIIGALLAMWMKYGSAGGDVILDSALANFLLDKFGIVLGLLPPEYQIIHDFFEYW
ncbi:MAG: CvpA family protein [Dehalococcoidales bacterium]|nr:CvpA family protein [Dehalococcoidales bacterium]